MPRSNYRGSGAIARKRLAMVAMAAIAGTTALVSSAEAVAPQGRFATAPKASPQELEELAQDALKQLQVAYPPSNTRFALARPASDRFGMLLASELRDRRYVIQSSPSPTSLALDYLVDQPADHVYRVTLSVDGRVVTRLYAKQGEGLGATGEWTGDASIKSPASVRAERAPGRPGGAPGRAAFAVAPSDTRLIPVLVRWAQEAGLVPVLDGRRVTVDTLAHEPYRDLPLTQQARAAAGATVDQATAEILKTYAGYRTTLEVRAERRAPKFLAITTTGPRTGSEAPETLAAASPPKSPSPIRLTPPRASPQDIQAAATAPDPQPSSALRPAPSAKGGFSAAPPSPQIDPPPAVAVEPTWDFAAKKAAGVMEGAWIVGHSKSLRAVVENWGAAAGVRVVWDSAHDYPVTNAMRGVIYPGTLKVALTHLAAAYGEFDVPLGMTFNTTQGKQELRVFDM